MYNLRDELTYDSPVSPGAVGNDLRREAWSRMKPRGTRSSEVAAAEELQAFPSSRLFNRTAVESSRTSEYCPSNRRRRLGGGGHSSHGAAPRLPDVLSRIFVPSYRPSSCRRRLRMRIGRGSSDQLSGTLSKSTEEREHWLVIAPIPPPESPEAWRRASEGGAEGQGASDGRMGCRNHD